MTEPLIAPKAVLLAVHLAANSDVAGLTSLAAQYHNVLHKELLLRILLTCLPETVPSTGYVGLVQRAHTDDWEHVQAADIDASAVAHLTDEEATRKARRLHLRPLKWPGAPDDVTDDPVTLFLLHRAYRVDEEAGLLTQLPELVVPFLSHAASIRTWVISALLPLLRRNYEYYPGEPIPYTLSAFQKLHDRAAVALLLSRTGDQEQDLSTIGRDFRGLIGPWLQSEARWQHANTGLQKEDSTQPLLWCPGWEEMLEWLLTQASKSWPVVVKVVEQWDGPKDLDLGAYGEPDLEVSRFQFLKLRYAQGALAAAYLVPEASTDALAGVNSIITRVMILLDQDPCPTLQVASSLLSPVTELADDSVLHAKNATFMRNDLLGESNILTTPSGVATQLLHALTLSAFIMTKAGSFCTIRRAGELAFIQDDREQKAEATKLIHALDNHGSRGDDGYWMRARNELLWLRDWGSEESVASHGKANPKGVFGQLKREFIEVECLKSFLSNSRYSLARSIYEDSFERPLPEKTLQETAIAAAMNAYDTASNPNRSRGGLLKCDDIIHAFPISLPEHSTPARRIESLLRATHALSSYRLVLKQGEPFTPVLLRVHSDPISIIGKVLEQNPKCYTRMQDMLEIGVNIVEAGLTVSKADRQHITTEQIALESALAERRIMAMCIDAALTEDDFETAYSYVVNRLASMCEHVLDTPATNAAARGGVSGMSKTVLVDDYSWKAALQAGKYRRTPRTLRPTHIGTASGNLDIRHLEQRIECLSTALRIAPPATLQEILNVFRRCEEELDAAVKAENEQESAWDDQGDVQAMPGAFSRTVPAGVHSYRPATNKSARHVDEAPMSLFDLAKATTSRAQRNFAALSSLQRSGQSRSEDDQSELTDGSTPARARKRDQLRDAAVGTLASGVGWLIGAQPSDRNTQRDSWG